MKANSGFSIFLIILSVSCLALGGIFVKLSALSPINTGFYRILFSIPILLPFIYAKKNRLSQLTRKERFLMLFAGAFLAFDLILWNISFHLTTVANANLLANLVPFTLIPIAHFLYKERVPGGFILGLVITLIGLFVLIKGKSAPTSGHFQGDFLAFLTSLFYGLFLATVYKLREKVDAMVIMFYSAFGSLFVLLPASIIEGFQVPNDWSSIWPILGLALFSQVLGQGGLSYCLGKVTSSLAAILVLTQPVISAIYAYFIFSEKLTWLEMSGIFIVIVGIYISKNRLSKSAKNGQD